MLFTKIEGAQCVLKSKGVHRQADVYRRGDRLFAKWGSGFIGLKAVHDGTTLPHVLWDHIELPEGLMFEAKGFDLHVTLPSQLGHLRSVGV